MVKLYLKPFMKTKLETLANTPASDIFDSIAFKNIVEDHLTWLIQHPNTVSKNITANEIEVYAFDWIGLLTSLKIPSDMHHTVIRMNGGQSLTDLPNDLRMLLVPSPTLLQNFVMLTVSTGKVR